MMSNIGLLAQGTKVKAENLLLANCGENLLALNIGGSYEFTHCTFANFWQYSSRQTPSIFLNNYYEDINGNIQNRDLINADFTKDEVREQYTEHLKLVRNYLTILEVMLNNG